MNDDSVTDYLRARGRVDPPAQLLGDVMRAVDATPQRRTWFAPFVPAVAVTGAAALVAVIAILVTQPRNVGPAPGPSGVEASAPSASPNATPTATASPSQPAPLIGRGAVATLPALDASGQWGNIRLERGEDVGGYLGVASAENLRIHYFENDPQAFYLEVFVHYTADLEPQPAEFGSGDWLLRAGQAELQPISKLELLVGGRYPLLTPGFPGAIDIFSTPVEGWLIFAVPRTAQDLTLRLEYRPTAATGVKRDVLVREPGPAPEHVASAKAPAEPSYVQKADLPFSVVDSPAADDLFGSPDTCTNPEAHYTIKYPDSWYTNTAIGDVPACSWFSPVFYQSDGSSRVPDEIVIVVAYSRGVGTIAGFGEPVLFREQLTVDGRHAVRTDTAGVGDGLVPMGGYRYEYTVTVAGTVPNDDNSAVVFFASTTWTPDDDPEGYRLNKAVLDRIMASIKFGD